MKSERTKRRHMGKAGFVSVGPVWVTPERKVQLEAEGAANRAKVLGKKSKERKDD